MSALDDLLAHPAVTKVADSRGLDYKDPDMISFHEAVCSLARWTASDGYRYAGLPLDLSDALEEITSAVSAALYAVLDQRRVEEES